jgi:hypothetical protein
MGEPVAGLAVVGVGVLLYLLAGDKFDGSEVAPAVRAACLCYLACRAAAPRAPAQAHRQVDARGETGGAGEHAIDEGLEEGGDK